MMMKRITKDQKIGYLKGMINSILGMEADGFMFYDGENDYLMNRALLMDYSVEEAEVYSEDFMTEVNRWVDAVNDEAGEA